MIDEIGSECEITQEENELRLFRIEIYDGLCPLCKENRIHEHDWKYGIEFNTQERVYSCRKCGFIAKKIHRWYESELGSVLMEVRDK